MTLGLEIERMASLPKLEKFLLTLANGITGLGIFIDYAVMTPELRYFIEFCKEEHDLSVSAIAPSSLVEKYNIKIRILHERIVSEVKALDQNWNSKENIARLLEDVESLHDLLSNVYDIARMSTIPV